MKKFEDISGLVVSGAFPATAAVNDTVVGANDGSGLLADWISQEWGWIQDVMSHADLTPDGTVEASGTGQVRKAIQNIAGPPGAGAIWWGQSDPQLSANPPRILLLDYSLILVADYQELVDAAWCGSSLNGSAQAFYRTNSGDTVRSDTGTHFRLADSRGTFLRGLDIAANYDPEGASRYVGEFQADATIDHQHQNVESAGGATNIQLGNASGDTPNAAAGSDLLVPTIASGFNTATRFRATGVVTENGGFGQPAISVSSESRPVNLACHFGIWY